MSSCVLFSINTLFYKSTSYIVPVVQVRNKIIPQSKLVEKCYFMLPLDKILKFLLSRTDYPLSIFYTGVNYRNLDIRLNQADRQNKEYVPSV